MSDPNDFGWHTSDFSSTASLNTKWYEFDSSSNEIRIKEIEEEDHCIVCGRPLDYDSYKLGMMGFPIDDPITKKTIRIHIHAICAWLLEEHL